MRKLAKILLVLFLLAFLSAVLFLAYLYNVERNSSIKSLSQCQFIDLVGLVEQADEKAGRPIFNRSSPDWYNYIDLSSIASSCAKGFLLINDRLLDLSGAEIILENVGNGNLRLRRIKGPSKDYVELYINKAEIVNELNRKKEERGRIYSP